METEELQKAEVRRCAHGEDGRISARAAEFVPGFLKWEGDKGSQLC